MTLLMPQAADICRGGGDRNNADSLHSDSNANVYDFWQFLRFDQ